jgi:hypothetical protein
VFDVEHLGHIADSLCLTAYLFIRSPRRRGRAASVELRCRAP